MLGGVNCGGLAEAGLLFTSGIGLTLGSTLGKGGDVLTFGRMDGPVYVFGVAQGRR